MASYVYVVVSADIAALEHDINRIAVRPFDVMFMTFPGLPSQRLTACSYTYFNLAMRFFVRSSFLAVLIMPRDL